VIRSQAPHHDESATRWMAARRIRVTGVSVASTKKMEAVIAGVGRVQRVTKEACHVESEV